MRMRTVIFLILLVSVSALVLIQAQDGENQHPLVEILALIPDVPPVREAGLSYADYAAIVALRPGAAPISSMAEYEMLRNAEDEAKSRSARLWMAAMSGIASGPPDLLRYGLSHADEMRPLVGFTIFEVERAATFLRPPETVMLLEGDFDQAAIGEALSALDYAEHDLGGMALWCGPDGCDQGARMNMQNRNPVNPFGGHLGRSQPVLLFSDYVISTTSHQLLEIYPLIAGGTVPTLADAPDFQAAVRLITEEGTLVQAHFYDAAAFAPQGAEAVLNPGLTAEEREALIAELQRRLETGTGALLPYYSLATFADIVDGDEQVVFIGLVYTSEQYAQMAAEVVGTRMNEATLAPAPDYSLMALVEERGATVTQYLYPDEETSLTVAVIELRAPMPPPEPADNSYPLLTQSSLVFKLIVNAFYQGNLTWLAVGLE